MSSSFQLRGPLPKNPLFALLLVGPPRVWMVIWALGWDLLLKPQIHHLASRRILEQIAVERRLLDRARMQMRALLPRVLEIADGFDRAGDGVEVFRAFYRRLHVLVEGEAEGEGGEGDVKAALVKKAEGGNGSV